MVSSLWLFAGLYDDGGEYSAALFICTDESFYDAHEYLDRQRWIGGIIANYVSDLVVGNSPRMAPTINLTIEIKDRGNMNYP